MAGGARTPSCTSAVAAAAAAALILPAIFSEHDPVGGNAAASAFVLSAPKSGGSSGASRRPFHLDSVAPERTSEATEAAAAPLRNGQRNGHRVPADQYDLAPSALVGDPNPLSFLDDGEDEDGEGAYDFHDGPSVGEPRSAATAAAAAAVPIAADQPNGGSSGTTTGSNSNNNNDQQHQQQQQQQQQLPPQFDINIGKGSSLTIPADGAISFPSTLLVEGRISGRIHCTSGSRPGTRVTVATGGSIEGNVTSAETVEVYGKVVGRIECKFLTVVAGAEIVGDVVCGSIFLEPGASVSGVVRCGKAAGIEDESLLATLDEQRQHFCEASIAVVAAAEEAKQQQVEAEAEAAAAAAALGPSSSAADVGPVVGAGPDLDSVTVAGGDVDVELELESFPERNGRHPPANGVSVAHVELSTNKEPLNGESYFDDISINGWGAAPASVDTKPPPVNGAKVNGWGGSPAHNTVTSSDHTRKNGVDQRTMSPSGGGSLLNGLTNDYSSDYHVDIEQVGQVNGHVVPPAYHDAQPRVNGHSDPTSSDSQNMNDSMRFKDDRAILDYLGQGKPATMENNGFAMPDSMSHERSLFRDALTGDIGREAKLSPAPSIAPTHSTAESEVDPPAVTYEEHAPRVLDKNGKISAQGTLDAIKERYERESDDPFYVDNFGNPLYRSANEDEVNTLRQNRDLLHDHRNLMEEYIRAKQEQSDAREQAIIENHSANLGIRNGRERSFGNVEDSDGNVGSLPDFLKGNG